MAPERLAEIALLGIPSVCGSAESLGAIRKAKDGFR